MSEANSNLSQMAAVVTLASHIAANAVNREWRKQGIRLEQFDAHDIAKAAKTYLSLHPELIEQAQSYLNKIPK